MLNVSNNLAQTTCICPLTHIFCEMNMLVYGLFYVASTSYSLILVLDMHALYLDHAYLCMNRLWKLHLSRNNLKIWLQSYYFFTSRWNCSIESYRNEFDLASFTSDVISFQLLAICWQWSDLVIRWTGSRDNICK